MVCLIPKSIKTTRLPCLSVGKAYGRAVVTSWVMSRPSMSSWCRARCYQGLLFFHAELAVGVFRVGVAAVRHHALDHAALAQPPHQRPRVDALNADHAVALHERFQRFLGAVVGKALAEFAPDKAAHERLVALHVVDRHAVVADMRIGHGHDLAVVARIGHDLLVAGHRGVEHHFAHRLAAVPESVAPVDRSIFQRQHGAFFANHTFLHLRLTGRF